MGRLLYQSWRGGGFLSFVLMAELVQMLMLEQEYFLFKDSEVLAKIKK
jgi:hypothetical protein